MNVGALVAAFFWQKKKKILKKNMNQNQLFNIAVNGENFQVNTGKLIVGLDIGTTKICAIVGRYNEYGKIDVLGVGTSPSYGVMRGVVSNIQKTTEAIKRAVAVASEHSDVNVKKVYVGIAGHHIKSYQKNSVITRNSYEEVITEADLKRLEEEVMKIPFPAGEEIIHVLPQEYTVDNEHGLRASDVTGMCGIRLECNFHIVTAQVTAVRNIVRCVQEAGLDIMDIILEPLASSEAALQQDELDGGIALVDIGGGTTDIAIFYDGVIRHTAVIPLGGNVITRDVEEGCLVMKDIAEKLKTQFGSAIRLQKPNEYITIDARRLNQREDKYISIDFLTAVINARAEEIVDLVAAELSASSFDRKIRNGLVITGGGALLKNLAQLVEYKTGHMTRLGLPNEHLSKGMVEEVRSPMYATAIGLLKMGLKKEAMKKVYKSEPVIAQEEPEEMKAERKVSKEFFNLKGLKNKVLGFLGDDEDMGDFQK